jgi:hypothetical protein
VSGGRVLRESLSIVGRVEVNGLVNVCPAHFGAGFANVESLQSNEDAYGLFNHAHMVSHGGDAKVRLD